VVSAIAIVVIFVISIIRWRRLNTQ
jgi:hypothetical protein